MNFFQVINEIRLKLEIPKIYLGDIIQILILAFIIYNAVIYIKNTQAWTLFKGIIVLLLVSLVIKLLNFNVLFWIISRSFTVLLLMAVVVFQPELRSALDKIGRKKFSKVIFSKVEDYDSSVDENSINEIVDACYKMSSTKTGALIVIEKEVPLNEFVKTGILLDAKISSQLILNTFEHNTPLHDGAMIIRNNRIIAATCYLPLSQNPNIDKDFGTRHRASVGVTEVTDAVCIAISEETGKVSVAISGKLYNNLNKDKLIEILSSNIVNENQEVNIRFKFIKEFFRNEKNVKK